MNILILSTHINTGGITSYILTLSKGIAKHKEHRLYVVTSGGDGVQRLAEYGIRHAQFDIKTKSELSPKIYLSLNKLCRFIRERNIDIIHAQTRVTQVLGFLAGRLTKRPYVATCHGFFKKRLSRMIFPCWGEATIAISEAVKEHLVKDFKIKQDKVALIHNGIDLKEFSVVDEALKKKKRAQYDLGDNPTIGTIGRLSDVKGHDILIRAMKKVVEKVPQATLLIVGQGKMEQKLSDLTRILDLQDNVNFYPIVDQTQEMLSLFDIFVMPSIQEGLGLSVLEAQGCALPVIASRVGGLSSLIEDGKTGVLVEPKDSDALAAAIVDLIENSKQAQAMGLAAREFVKENFLAENMITKTIDFYQRVVDKKK